MDLVYKGKTKDVYALPDGTYRLQFKDDVTGVDGVFDPGANQVGLSIEGSGRSNVVMSRYYFEMFEDQGIPTHYLSSDIENQTMDVKPAEFFGKGIEVICRYRAVGSFIRRYGLYAKDGDKLDGYVEITLKDDEREDPLVNEDALLALNILRPGEYDEIKKATKQISQLIKDDLADKGLELYDLKLEFGRDKDGKLMLIDEVSAGNMRVYQGDQSVGHLELATFF
ncbi:phosphoribosylaminoimidazolesuccinocarboxamide synthase [Dolosicoccus paucivorans]|uniref:phosphoribosylaminoimidazolesuccinocarboxamide synthase n=1 Tax=Dolosicoccus paucivorans TaxID=84521 RepID=A0A1G8NVC4_9LACT|nr:phosphoribosylaminoimidazolesuccinocarboxamide synthase [Dolosicoccus paucivorans]PMB84218.1 phosphoribosylaminoimidazolesuccinocarboxamide synthase [Dolosicoccus paucivorans]PMC58681.1 phosphoribosylaminoimidazolesuccinocarboxamide synthase [Dolosicoccus paucivorans]SDI83906.1 phosphoribosylaminoimidazole-succinocarboxamide synthase [Dolosicoccus paucivorans]